jgi:orotate phosphoribosyltransferase
LRELTADWDYAAAGGLTLGADPVGTAIMHASDGTVDAFVVRKAEKKHGMQQRVEGPSVAGRRVLVVEDVSTTGGSPLTAVQALTEAGAEVVGVALIVDRGAADTIRQSGLECRSAFSLGDLGLA